MPTSRAPASVLILDDDLGLLRLIEKTLRREGHRTVVASTGKTALEWLSKNEPDLLLLDLKLPDVSGPELIQRLVETQRTLPFVVITGQGDERVAVEMMKQGALDYLVKDAEFLKFLPAVVERSLNQIEKERKLAAAERSLRISEEALKREHQFASALLNTSGALIVVLDLEARIVRFNPACERITGYRFDEVRGKTIWELFIAPEEMAAVKGVFDALRRGESPSQHENYWITRDGQRRLIGWSNACHLTQGQAEYIVASGIDLTEHKRLEREILEISELEQRRIGQDLHDGLCQHLAGIELMTQALQRNLEKRSKSAAAQAGKIAAHVRESISQTRMLARGLSPVQLDANGLMSALEELAANTEHLFQVQCRFHCAAPVLLGDHDAATHLYRIAQESVSNAIRHGRAKKIDITLRHDQDRLLLTIQDNGVGMTPGSEDAPDEPESGMGIRTMLYRARMISGTLDIQTKPGRGAVVTCTRDHQPAVSAAGAAAAATPAPAQNTLATV